MLGAYPSAQAVGIDIPIGVVETYGRAADVAARRFVQPRGSSVFPTPPRAVLEASDYDRARAVADERGWPRPSKQSWGMRHRILEVDRAAREDARIFEVHPEVSFRELAGRPLEPKRSPVGQLQRRDALAAAGIDLDDPIDDDLLDAAVAAWSAHRFATGRAVPLPPDHRERVGAIWR